jgi:hypothetical protein
MTPTEFLLFIIAVEGLAGLFVKLYQLFGRTDR